MKSNFELWKEGKLSMFIVSFTINGNGVSGSDSITYSEAVSTLQEQVLKVYQR